MIPQAAWDDFWRAWDFVKANGRLAGFSADWLMKRIADYEDAL